MRRKATGKPYRAAEVTHTGATEPEKAKAITAPTASRESSATTAAQIMRGRRYRVGVMDVTLTACVPPVWTALESRIPGPVRITLKDTDQHGPGCHTLNPHISADAVTAGRVSRRQNEEG
jgi:hypothetical protein